VGEAAGRVLARDPKEIVARGYDAIALHYAEWAGRIESPLLEWVRDFDARLPDRSNVLELGCGRGVPVARQLARRHQLTGADISAVQIELARHHVPEASFVHVDAMELDVAAASVDGVLALHVLGHIPMHEQPGLIERIGTWLRPGGFLLATLGAGAAGEMVEDDWPGAPMFFALYFLITGLHGIHVIVGMTVLSVVGLRAGRGAYARAYHVPVELAGLYWHLVDLIWIFVFPLIYLI
jgi:SAM-dependent methyltransferase